MCTWSNTIICVLGERLEQTEELLQAELGEAAFRGGERGAGMLFSYPTPYIRAFGEHNLRGPFNKPLLQDPALKSCLLPQGWNCDLAETGSWQAQLLAQLMKVLK